MNKHNVLFSIFAGFFVFSLAFVPAFAEKGVKGGEVKEVRVFTRDRAQAAKALEAGCEVKKEARKTIVLACTSGIASLLGLQEDIQAFAQEEIGEKRREGGGVTTQSASANSQIGANTVHAAGNTGAGRKIVILDTGYNYLHPELSAASSYGGGWDFVNNDADSMDDNGHGSHVAGLITADGVNAFAKGTAPDATVIAGKVLNAAGSGYFSDIIEGIYWAVDGPDGVTGSGDEWGADAINMSLGTGRPYTYKGFCDGVMPDLTTAIKYAVDKGVAVVSAAGNSGSAGVSIPGCISYSTTVGAVDSSDRIASFSGRGTAVDITAPGVSLLSAWTGSSYVYASGTSMATPIISAVVALIKSAHPAYLLSQAQDALFKTAKDLGKSGKDANFGWGRVNAAGAVAY